MIIFSVEECVLSKWWWFTPCEWSPGSVYTPRLPLPPPHTHTSAAQDLVAFHPHLVQGERFCSLQTHPHSPLLRFATVQWKEKILPHPWSTWPSTINSNNVVVSVSWVSLLHPCLILRLKLRDKLGSCWLVKKEMMKAWNKAIVGRVGKRGAQLKKFWGYIRTFIFWWLIDWSERK